MQTTVVLVKSVLADRIVALLFESGLLALVPSLVQTSIDPLSLSDSEWVTGQEWTVASITSSGGRCGLLVRVAGQ